MEHKNPVEAPEEGKKTDNVVYFGFCSGIPFVIYGKDCHLYQTNLGQKWKGTPKYKVCSENGCPTGMGYAFEDVFARKMRQAEYKVVKVNEYKNGADFLINGIPVQCKYGSSPDIVFKSLFKDGKFRYPNQIIITNKENEEGLRKLCSENSELFGGNTPKINPAEYVGCNSKEVQEQYQRGWGAIKNDTKDFFKSPRSCNILFGGMLTVFLCFIGIGTVVEYRRDRKSAPKKSRLKCLGDAVEKSTKKHGKKALISSLVIGFGTIGAYLIKCQFSRFA